MAFRAYIVIVAFSALRPVAPAHFPELLPLSKWWLGDEHMERLDNERGEWEGANLQVVYLPALLPREAQLMADSSHVDIPVPYKFDAFGRNFDLNLVPNRRLVAKQFSVWSDGKQDDQLSSVDTSCHFLHSGPDVVAALSSCKDHTLQGLIVTDNSTYEVRPLPASHGRSRNEHDGIAHVIRRATPPTPPHDDAKLLRSRSRLHRKPRSKLRYLKSGSPRYTIELALYLDEAAYNVFYPFLNHNEKELRDMLLAYINAVQALYRHASLGTQIQMTLVRMTLINRNPPTLTTSANRDELLDSFCQYQQSLNVEDDNDPHHWDMAILLTGLDIYNNEDGDRKLFTMGLSPVRGVCLAPHACLLTEFGTTLNSNPYPSTGFTSVYILAHEIGHNLGMYHDGVGNSCALEGYIMSPSRGTKGETTWSTCSAEVVADLDWATCLLDGADDVIPEESNHEIFFGAPGFIWNAKKQCEILLRDVDAEAINSHSEQQCIQLTCRGHHRLGDYYAGPAMPGTPCGKKKWCQGGECVPLGNVPMAVTSIPQTVIGGGWSTWTEGTCQSGCTIQGQGFIERRRTCALSYGCKGSAYQSAICDDTKVCGKKIRVSASELAARKCTEYASKVPDLDPNGGGLQAPHDSIRLWMGCAIFCRRASSDGFYAPRVELNDIGQDAYFPDGTWCHHDGTQNYYCMQHHCLPENFKIDPEMHVWDLPSGDIGGPFNARAIKTPEDDAAQAAIKAYLSLDHKGVPILRSQMAPIFPEESERNWEDKDYVEI